MIEVTVPDVCKEYRSLVGKFLFFMNKNQITLGRMDKVTALADGRISIVMSVATEVGSCSLHIENEILQSPCKLFETKKEILDYLSNNEIGVEHDI